MNKGKGLAGLRSMSKFNPLIPALVHDQLNGWTFQWRPEKWGADYEGIACKDFSPGIVEWDGLLLGGWRPMMLR